jgi:hypothetical protein
MSSTEVSAARTFPLSELAPDQESLNEWIAPR